MPVSSIFCLLVPLAVLSNFFFFTFLHYLVSVYQLLGKLLLFTVVQWTLFIDCDDAFTHLTL